jgi:hypothetical protein
MISFKCLYLVISNLLLNSLRCVLLVGFEVYFCVSFNLKLFHRLCKVMGKKVYVAFYPYAIENIL